MTSIMSTQSFASQRRSLTRLRPRAGRILWTMQVLLCALFLFAGSGKLLASSHTLTTEFSMPAAFMRFIGCCEILGAVGVLFPGWLRIRPALTPSAAGGLVGIMIGAVVVTLMQGGGALVAGPAIVGVSASLVAYGRRSWMTAGRR